MNAESEWIVAEVPELRMINDKLWQAVKARQSEIADKYVNVTEAIREAQSNRLNGMRRPKALFSGSIHCGVCGGPCALRGQDTLCVFGPCYQWLLREHPHDRTG
jgi:hypothetical protein